MFLVDTYATLLLSLALPCLGTGGVNLIVMLFSYKRRTITYEATPRSVLLVSAD